MPYETLLRDLAGLEHARVSLVGHVRPSSSASQAGPAARASGAAEHELRDGTWGDPTRAGNLKAVQKFLGHESIQTTGDIYTDWDIDQLAETLLEAVDDD
jgi:integrase